MAYVALGGRQGALIQTELLGLAKDLIKCVHLNRITQSRSGAVSDDMADLGGSFSRNFAQIRGRDCYVVDDTITSGTTMNETIEAIRNRGGEPVCCGVLADKQGVEAIDDVPVHSLLQVIAVESDRQ